MSNNNCRNRYYKSAQTAYNNTAQAYAAAGTQINIEGNLATNTGCSIDTQTGGFNINDTGLYRISYDVTHTPSAAGVAIVQLYNGAGALPCAISQETVAADSVYTTHVETVLYLAACCAIRPAISARISGVAGTVNHVCASVVRLA